MLMFSAQGRSGPFRTGGRSSRLVELSGQVERARPGLPPEAPEHRAAMLLLLISEVGLNVDRLVLRTGFPREFVARCLRRLVDNAWWVDGAPPENWCADPLSCRDFWLDVDVALGRRLRRVDEHGRPEWARVGEWVKDFEYSGPQPTDDPVHTDYREIPPHNPEAVLWKEEDEGAAEPASPDEPGRAATPASGADAHEAEEEAPGPASPPADALLDSWEGADWLG